MLKNGLNLHVTNHQKIRHYRTKSTQERILFEEEQREEERRMPNHEILLCAVVCKLQYYSNILHSFDWKSAVEHDGGI